MMNYDELRAWISAHFWKSEQVAQWVEAHFYRKKVHQQTSSGAGSGSLPVITNSNGVLDVSFLGLSADWDIGEDRSIAAERIEARDSEGLRLEDDGGNLGIFIEDGGLVGIGQSSPNASPHVTRSSGYESYTDTRGTTSYAGAVLNNTITDSGFTSPFQSVYVDTNANLSSNPASGKAINSICSFGIVPNGNTSTLTNLTLRGVNFVARHGGTGTIGALAGCAGVVVNQLGGTVTSSTAVEPGIHNLNASGVVTTAYGVRVIDLVNLGTIGTTYGVHVGDLTTGTQTNVPHSFYASDSATYNYFAGKSAIGSITIPTALLHLSQTFTTGEALRVIRDLTASSTDSPLVNLIQDHTGDDQIALRVQQDGTGNILSLFDGGSEVVKVADGGVVTMTSGWAINNETFTSFDTGSYTPAITSSNADFTTSYTTQTGRYTRFHDVVYVYANIVIGTISAAGTGNLRISLPSTADTDSVLNIYISGVDTPATPASVVFVAGATQAYGHIFSLHDNAASTLIQITALANGDQIVVMGAYFDNP